MVSFAPTSDETREDQRLYLDGRLTELACLDCLAKVGVKKNSEHHTSIQWNAEALETCHEFSRLGQGREMQAPCSRLAATIDRAVREGELEVGSIEY